MIVIIISFKQVYRQLHIAVPKLGYYTCVGMDLTWLCGQAVWIEGEAVGDIQ